MSVKARPSGLHTWRVVADRQVEVPGVHVQGVQVPGPTQAFISGHAAGVYPRPSALHCLRVFTSTHEKLPGVHAHGVQVPPWQLCIAGQSVVVEVRPSAAHARTRTPSHERVPGMHVQPAHIPVDMLHELLDGHAISGA